MEIKSNDLATALQTAAIVIESRNTIPILGHAVIDYQGGETAIIRAMNLDQEIIVGAPVINGKPIRAAFGAPKAIATLATAGSAKSVVIEAMSKEEAGKHVLRGEQFTGEINTLPAEDMPRLDVSAVPDFTAELGVSALDMLFRVAGAMSQEETRYYLNGIYFHHVEGWTYRAVATDGHRLYYGNIELPNAQGPSIVGAGSLMGRDGGGGIIIPRHMLLQLQRLRPRMDKDQAIRFTVASPLPANQPEDLGAKPAGAMSRVRFSFVQRGMPVTLTSKTIDGTFPDYTRVIPQQNDTDQQVTFRRADLQRAIHGITAGQSERVRAIKLTFDPAAEKLIVSTQWIDVGFTGRMEIPAKAKTADNKPFEIGYNGGYLRAICDASRGDDLTINVADPASPGTITDPAATDFRTVLMPMRV